MEILTLVLVVIILASCLSITYFFIQQGKKMQELNEGVNKRLNAIELNLKEESERTLREIKSSLSIIETQVDRVVKATHNNEDIIIQSKNEIIEIHAKNTLALNRIQEDITKLETKLAKDLVEDVGKQLKSLEETINKLEMRLGRDLRGDMVKLSKDMQGLYEKYAQEHENKVGSAINEMQGLSKDMQSLYEKHAQKHENKVDSAINEMQSLSKAMQELYEKHTQEYENKTSSAINEMQVLSKNIEKHLDEIYHSITEPLKLS